MAGKMGASGSEHRAIELPVIAGLITPMGLKVATVSVQPPCLDRSKRPLQWPDLAEEQRGRFDRFGATASSQLSSPDGPTPCGKPHGAPGFAAIPRAP